MNGETARPKVSVVVPIYKVEKYLVRCLESVVDQTLKDLEIILVDEGEQDRCREIIDYYEQIDPRVVTIHEPNPDASFGAKVNRGLDRATGEFVAIVESDDFIGLEMYEQMYECAVRTGANIVKTPFYNYRTKDDNEVDRSRGYINANVPKDTLFSIFQFPDLLVIHPSPWSAIYRREVLVEQGIRCLEPPRAGYVDNCFYVDTYVRMGKIVWLNKPFYRWRTNSVTSSSLPQNWNRPMLLERWNRNLDLYPPQSEQYGVFAPYFAGKAWATLFRHYLDGWKFNEEEYAAITAFLRRFSEEQIMAAVRVSEEHRALMLQCRNDPEGFRKAYFPGGKGTAAVDMDAPPQTRAERIWECLADEGLGTVLFWAAVYLLLLALTVRAGVFGGLLARGPLAAVCGTLAALGIPALAVCRAARRRKKRLDSETAGTEAAAADKKAEK